MVLIGYTYICADLLLATAEVYASACGVLSDLQARPGPPASMTVPTDLHVHPDIPRVGKALRECHAETPNCRLASHGAMFKAILTVYQGSGPRSACGPPSLACPRLHCLTPGYQERFPVVIVVVENDIVSGEYPSGLILGRQLLWQGPQRMGALLSPVPSSIHSISPRLHTPCASTCRRSGVNFTPAFHRR